MDRVLSALKMIGIILLTFIMQIFISNNFEIFGVTPNLILVSVVIISMWNNITFNIISACIIGGLSDLIFHFGFGQSIVAYLVIALCISYISNSYRKESKVAIVYITIMATCIFTAFQFVYYIIDSNLIANIFAILKMLIVEILLNIALACILYKIFEKSMKKDDINKIYR